MAVKLHFTQDSFDVFKNPKVKCSNSKIDVRNDRMVFDKLTYKYKEDRDLIQFYVANFAYNNKRLLYEDTESELCYKEWIKRKESRTKILCDDIGKIMNQIERNSIPKDRVLYFTHGEIPLLLNMFIGDHISIESLRIIDDYLDIVNGWKTSSFCVLWGDDIRRVTKLKNFVRYDESRVKPIIDEFVEFLNSL